MDSTRMILSWFNAPAILTIEQASCLLGINSEMVKNSCVNASFPAMKIKKKWMIDKQRLMRMFGQDMVHNKKYLGSLNMYKKQYYSWDEVPAILTLEQVGVLLDFNEESTRRYCMNGDLPAVKIGKQWRIDKQKLMEMFGY